MLTLVSETLSEKPYFVILKNKFVYIVNDILQGKVGSLRRSLGVKRTKEITNNDDEQFYFDHYNEEALLNIRTTQRKII